MKPTLETLLDHWETGTLDAAGQQQLTELLDHPETRAKLAQRWVFESALEDYWQETTPGEKVVPIEPPRRRVKPLLWGLSAAALLMVTLAGLWFATKPPESPTSPTPLPLAEAPAATPVEPEPARVAPPPSLTPLDESGHWTVTRQDPMFVVMGPWRIKAYPQTRFRLVPTRGALVLELLQGAVRMEVSAAEPSGLEFRTRDLRGQLEGGHAMLLALPESTWLTVGEGAATASGHDGVITLASGQLLHTGPPHSHETRSIDASPAWNEWVQKVAGEEYP